VQITFTPEATGVTQPIDVAATETSKEISGLTLGTPYTFTVKTKDAEGVLSSGRSVQASLPITSSDALATYLEAATGGATADAPVSVVVSVDVSDSTKLGALYAAVGTGGKFVALDLSASQATSIGYVNDDAGKDKIVSLTLPTTITEIVDPTEWYEGAFNGENFTALTTVIGEGVVTIGQRAFQDTDSNNDTSSLTTVSFPNATTIKGMAFQDCKALVNVSFPKATSIDNYAFLGTALTEASFPKVESIGTEAFKNCATLATLSFPEATSIGEWAFTGCNALVNIPETSFPKVESIGGNAFNGVATLATVSFPKATTIGGGAFRDSPAITTVSFPEATSTGNSAFASCEALATVSFPKATSIEDWTFYHCYALVSIPATSFPEATSIGNSTFDTCSALVTAAFPKVASVDAWAFNHCGELTTATFAQGASIDGNAFSDCPKYQQP
jgi:hypothetical protein